MKIQKSRNQREGDCVGYWDGKWHRLGGVLRNDYRKKTGYKKTRHQRKRDKMQPADNDYSGCWPETQFDF